MPTNEERRTIARNLRACAKAISPSAGDEVLGHCIRLALDVEPVVGSRADELLMRLSDLIDPDCVDETWCKVCGHIIPEGWEECPRCKTEVQNADE